MAKRLLSLLVLIALVSCGEEDAIPRPRGYFRIDLPAHQYKQFETDCPFSFEIPDYALMTPGAQGAAQPCWLNLVFPAQKATLHLSYRSIEKNLSDLTEDSRNLAYKHVVKSSGIAESLYEDPENHVYGIMYEINGNAASPLQFHVSDSSSHFLRGSLYFNTSPNSDSLQPVNEFIREDVRHLISTVRWK
ncbi:MAG: gliding motility lipoprotein GldD [Bacteroidetes bacterium]|nr:gliding motility lipoprotein GldD [Bacteroidota bacterium]